MPGIEEDMEAAMQQAAHPIRHSIKRAPPSDRLVGFLYVSDGNIAREDSKEKFDVRMGKRGKDLLERYATVRDYGCKEIVIKRSRFIGHAKPAETEEEAVQFIEQIKKKYWDATHNCSAYYIGERGEWQKALDDGEPSGTAGKPILEVIKNKNLINVVVVVTRYFGGIMLGAGGLVRAYTDGAIAGIEAAGPIVKVLHREIFVDIDYTWYGKLENALRDRGIRIGDISFTDRVRVLCLPEAGKAEAFRAWITDFTQGQALVETGEERYYIENE
jgi:uncharacterized YigZ family protein